MTNPADFIAAAERFNCTASFPIAGVVLLVGKADDVVIAVLHLGFVLADVSTSLHLFDGFVVDEDGRIVSAGEHAARRVLATLTPHDGPIGVFDVDPEDDSPSDLRGSVVVLDDGPTMATIWIATT